MVSRNSIAVAAGSVILIGLGAIMAVSFLNRSIDVPPRRAERTGPLSKDAVSSKYEEIRLQYRQFAFRQRNILKRLLHASPGDLRTLREAYSSLPDKPEDAGIPHSALFAPPYLCTWDTQIDDPRLRPAQGASARAQRDYQKSVGYIHDRLQKDFASHHDIAISRCSKAGAAQYTFWASGRITESTFNGKAPIFQDAGWDVREIEPPYDFLK
jgi:hypothetical protein